MVLVVFSDPDIRFLESLTEQLDLKIKKLGETNTEKTTKENHPKTLLSDEFLDMHLDKIKLKKSVKAQHDIIPPREDKEKSLFKRIFSK